MRPLSAGWPAIRQRVLSAQHVLLCCDFDGTLAPIANHPLQARLPVDTQRLLEQLASLPGLRVALVSGRALADLKRHVGLPRLIYIGNHGLELQGPRLRYTHPAARTSRPLLKQITRRLQSLIRPIPGAWIEDKELTLSLHWRRVPPSWCRQFHRVITQALAPDVKQRRIQLTSGKRVIEVRPPGHWHKGTALRWLLQRVSSSSRRSPMAVIYFGDDQTDEEAFRVVNQAGGISVCVGARPSTTAARWWVRSPRDVHAVLARLLEERWQIPSRSGFTQA